MDDFFVRLVTLAQNLGRRIGHFFEDLVSRDVDRHPQDSAVPFSGQHPRSLCSIYQSTLEDYSEPSKPLDARRTTAFKENPSVNASSEIVETQHSFWDSGPSIFQGFISRMQRTLLGSSGDIGWLQRTPGVPPVENGTTRFMELLHSIRNGEHSLPSSFVYLLIPGLFSNLSPLYFVSTKRFFSKMGLTCHIAKIHSEASVEQNAWELKQYIEELYWGSNKCILLLGHSKGGVDAAAALSIYWPDLREKVAGLALVQSPYGGSPIASDILREGQIADKEARRIMELLICKLIKGDMKALEDITYEKRKEFIANHKLPEQVPIVSFYTEASIAPGVLATMSHIAHAELPWFPLPSFDTELPNSPCKVPVMFPLSAAMAIAALHLKLRYGEMSDGLVTCRDAVVPGSVVVKPHRRLDHAWMVYSSWKKDMVEADASEMCEALLTLLVEVGKMKQKRVRI